MELDGSGSQRVVLFDVVPNGELAGGAERASRYLRTFSDEYLRRTMQRESD